MFGFIYIFVFSSFTKLSDACLSLKADNHVVIQLVCKLAHILRVLRKALQACELASVSPAPIYQKIFFPRYIY